VDERTGNYGASKETRTGLLVRASYRFLFIPIGQDKEKGRNPGFVFLRLSVCDGTIFTSETQGRRLDLASGIARAHAAYIN
jgi:hypothetical protein